jgi:hypothetical protein
VRTVLRLLVFAAPLALPFGAVWLFVGFQNDARIAQTCRTAYWQAGESGGHAAGRVAERDCLASNR